MLTRATIRNFKRLGRAEIELGQTVVLIGPNNSGKTTALQALALWDIGVRQWITKRGLKALPEKRPGVAINRKDLIAIPVPSADLLWRDLHVRNVRRIKDRGKDKTTTKNIRIDIIVEGLNDGKQWKCGLEFDYTNEESFICRPLRLPGHEESAVKGAQFTEVPEPAAKVRVSFLPPMSGLAAVEPKLEPGRLSVLIGEGQTAQVLRNLCFQVYDRADQSAWGEIVTRIQKLFGVSVLPPKYVAERGEITMAYKEPNGTVLDLSSSGRGLQQTLLVLTYLYANPGTVLLIDEPDAHLEILRQRETYQLITETAQRLGSQIIAASHSEVVLNEAADRDVVIAFVGSPHRIDGRGSQVIKALTEIGYDQYYQAEYKGWILYLEGPTDLAILQVFAQTLQHAAAAASLERVFVHYVTTNLPQKARDHFYGLREAKEDLVGIAIFDRLEKKLEKGGALAELRWERKEIENYLCLPEVLYAFARQGLPEDLFGGAEADRRERIMKEAVDELSKALKTARKPDPWSADIKATDDFLDPLFENYFEKLGLPNLLRKTDYHVLARLVPKNRIAPEVTAKLDAIVAVAEKAKPREE